MLVLSRKVGEVLKIGDNIAVTITRIAGCRVTVGIEAPSHVTVIRAELEREPLPDDPTTLTDGDE